MFVTDHFHTMSGTAVLNMMNNKYPKGLKHMSLKEAKTVIHHIFIDVIRMDNALSNEEAGAWDLLMDYAMRVIYSHIPEEVVA